VIYCTVRVFLVWPGRRLRFTSLSPPSLYFAAVALATMLLTPAQPLGRFDEITDLVEKAARPPSQSRHTCNSHRLTPRA